MLNIINSIEKEIMKPISYLSVDEFIEIINTPRIIEKYFKKPSDSIKLLEYISNINSDLRYFCSILIYSFKILESQEMLNSIFAKEIVSREELNEMTNSGDTIMSCFGCIGLTTILEDGSEIFQLIENKVNEMIFLIKSLEINTFSFSVVKNLLECTLYLKNYFELRNQCRLKCDNHLLDIIIEIIHNYENNAEIINLGINPEDLGLIDITLK